jgi:hypothetical protein
VKAVRPGPKARPYLDGWRGRCRIKRYLRAGPKALRKWRCPRDRPSELDGPEWLFYGTGAGRNPGAKRRGKLKVAGLSEGIGDDGSSAWLEI